MTFAQQLTAHLRLAILQAIDAMPARALHEYVLLECLAGLGLGITADRLAVELRWLEDDARLVTLEATGRAQIVRLTPRGVEVATGLAHCPGVARPRD